MFGQARPVVFDPYRRQRRRGRPPKWLVLLLTGITLGAAGVIVVEQRYLPPRLSFEESTELREAFGKAEAERLRLKAELDGTSKRLADALAGEKKRSDELAASRGAVDGLRSSIATLVAALPPDPRGGDIEVRAGRFIASAGQLAYDVVLTRPGAPSRPLDGVMQLVVSGAAQGRETTVALPPVALKIAGHEVLRGSAKLPDGFMPKQTTVQLLDRTGGRSLGMRVMLVK